MQSHVVFHLKCLDCDAEYIGKTSRQIERRFENINQAAKIKIHMIHRVLSMKKIIIIQLITIILEKATTDQMVLIKKMIHIDRLKPS